MRLHCIVLAALAATTSAFKAPRAVGVGVISAATITVKTTDVTTVVTTSLVTTTEVSTATDTTTITEPGPTVTTIATTTVPAGTTTAVTTATITDTTTIPAGTTTVITTATVTDTTTLPAGTTTAIITATITDTTTATTTATTTDFATTTATTTVTATETAEWEPPGCGGQCSLSESAVLFSGQVGYLNDPATGQPLFAHVTTGRRFLKTYFSAPYGTWLRLFKVRTGSFGLQTLGKAEAERQASTPARATGLSAKSFTNEDIFITTVGKCVGPGTYVWRWQNLASRKQFYTGEIAAWLIDDEDAVAC